MQKNHFQVIKETRISAPASLLTLHPGETVEIQCAEFAPYSTIAAAVCRLNQRADFLEFQIVPQNNSTTAVVTRNKKESL